MSFFRPEATRLIARWAEPAIYAALTVAATIWLIGDGPAGWFGWALAAFVLAVGALLTRSAALSALSDLDREAPGVVKIDERRIAFFGPHGGGVVALDELQAVEIWGADPDHWRYEPEWVLRGAAPEALIVPVAAIGAEGMIDAFAALPGFAPTRALAALSTPDGATVTIWRRAGAPSAPALAPTPCADGGR